MPTDCNLDANVILRYLIGDHPAHATAVKTLLEQAEQGAVRLFVGALVVAECVWVLRSFYKMDPAEVTRGLISFLALDGIRVEEEDVVIETLQLMASRRVDFTDAYLAVSSRSTGRPVASFDHDFKKLGCDVMVPGT